MPEKKYIDLAGAEMELTLTNKGKLNIWVTNIDDDIKNTTSTNSIQLEREDVEDLILNLTDLLNKKVQ